MRVSPLKWIPLPVDPPITPPAGLKDFQVGWFWNLFWASLRTENIGYLPLSDDLWMLAGALTRERWDANSSAVLAAFEILELPGHRRLLFLPSLKKIIEAQMERLRGKRKTPSPAEDFQSFNRDPQISGALSTSLFDFDVGSKKENDLPERKKGDARQTECANCRSSATGWCYDCFYAGVPVQELAPRRGPVGDRDPDRARGAAKTRAKAVR